MKRMAFLSLAVMTTLTAGCSSNRGKDLGQTRASEPATAGTSVAPEIAHQDSKDFIYHLALVNMAEIDLGRLAVERGSTDAVKTYAQMMIDNHTGTAGKLEALASDLKIEAPGQLDDKHRDQRDKLATRSGAAFDREYASAMVDEHKDLIDQLAPRIDKKTLEQWTVAMHGKTPATAVTVALLPDPGDNPTTMRINQFAAAIYPTVYAHLEAAKALESSLKKQLTTP